MTLGHLTLAVALLTWIMLLAAAQLRTRGDLALGTGNRDDLPEPTPLAARADRAAKNMLENVILYGVILLAVGGGNASRAILGAEIFLAARFLYWLIYLAGIPRIRTLVWGAGVVGLVIMASAGF
jgi:uncharacterized MAPEG superfamily protein